MFAILSTCKGGGYRYCRTSPRHPRANAKGLYPLHRVLMENKIGRLLRPDEDVHHADGNKTNNVIENLELLERAEHARRHHPSLPTVKRRCAACGSEFEIKAHIARLREGRNKSRSVSCGRSCGGRQGHTQRAA